MTKLLIVDDSPLMRKLLTEIFVEAGGFDLAVARDGGEALEQLHAFAPDVVTLDIHMPGLDGLACLDRIMVERPTPVVMVSSLTEEGAEETLEALSLGAVDFVAKPRGPLSLEIDNVAALLVQKVRAAAGARLSRATRLTDRVRLRTARPPRPARPAKRAARRKASGKLEGVAAVLVGVSTGGPPALDVLLEPIPADFPWPIVIAQHMPRSFTGPLARRLDGRCAISVVEVTRPTPLQPGHAYIGRGDADLLVSRRSAGVVAMPAPARPDLHWHPNTDRLVESAIAALGAQALVGVLMTGMGSDGAKAMAALRQGGGHVIAQDAGTSVVWGMPGALVALEGADLILPLPEIAPQLIDWAVG
ncbi:chemotaxis-specific protein-glutamate methyltransferase CheB [Sphingobium lignivorans]|uniref:Protein-glutamate methylesterase/protein-glutamine glutaminase n=1 Tax=Sphingobium lignivorans TaxID=2735886 RepID=A0ABR6NDV9_9SPHN|nr:two-component system chemotaxis response regulator CheB [Sphingobium lignivorans]